MFGPGKLLFALQHLLSGVAAAAVIAAAAPALAEGRHDPILTCTFENGRALTLYQNGGGTDWVEGDLRAPAANYAESRKLGDALVTVVAYLRGGAERLDVFAPLTPPQDAAPHPAPLAALLSRTLVVGASMKVSTVPGTCAEVHG